MPSDPLTPERLAEIEAEIARVGLADRLHPLCASLRAAWAERDVERARVEACRAEWEEALASAERLEAERDIARRDVDHINGKAYSYFSAWRDTRAWLDAAGARAEALEAEAEQLRAEVERLRGENEGMCAAARFAVVEVECARLRLSALKGDILVERADDDMDGASLGLQSALDEDYCAECLTVPCGGAHDPA
jgi:hypothetical protein